MISFMISFLVVEKYIIDPANYVILGRVLSPVRRRRRKRSGPDRHATTRRPVVVLW